MKRIRVSASSLQCDESSLVTLCAKPNFYLGEEIDFQFDWTKCDFISISQIVALAIFVKRFNLKDCIDSNGIKENVRQYISRMDFFKYVGLQQIEDFNRHAEKNRFLPLLVIQDDFDINSLVNRLMDIIVSKLEVQDSVKSAIDYSIGEILDNVEMHAQSKIGGLLGAQYFPNLGFLEVCVADGGIGIDSSMKENQIYAKLSSEDRMAKAFERKTGQWIGKEDYGSEKVSGGVGPSVLSNFVRAANGNLLAIANESSIKIDRQRGIQKVPNLYFPGTIISFRIPVDRTIDIQTNDLLPDEAKGSFRYNSKDAIYSEKSQEGPLW